MSWDDVLKARDFVAGLPMEEPMKHAPAPWKLEPSYPEVEWKRSISTERGNMCVAVNLPADNAARIVECVNACEGINNPAAIVKLIEAAKAAEKCPAEDEAHHLARILKALAALGVK